MLTGLCTGQAVCLNRANTGKYCCVCSAGEGCSWGYLEPAEQTRCVTSSAGRVRVFWLLVFVFSSYDSFSLTNVKTTA